MAELSTPFRFIREQVFKVPTQDAFAEMLGYTQAQISRLESGSRRISRSTQDRIRDLARKRDVKWQDKWFFEVPADAA